MSKINSMMAGVTAAFIAGCGMSEGQDQATVAADAPQQEAAVTTLGGKDGKAWVRDNSVRAQNDRADREADHVFYNEALNKIYFARDYPGAAPASFPEGTKELYVRKGSVDDGVVDEKDIYPMVEIVEADVEQVFVNEKTGIVVDQKDIRSVDVSQRGETPKYRAVIGPDQDPVTNKYVNVGTTKIGDTLDPANVNDLRKDGYKYVDHPQIMLDSIEETAKATPEPEAAPKPTAAELEQAENTAREMARVTAARAVANEVLSRGSTPQAIPPAPPPLEAAKPVAPTLDALAGVSPESFQMLLPPSAEGMDAQQAQMQISNAANNAISYMRWTYTDHEPSHKKFTPEQKEQLIKAYDQAGLKDYADVFRAADKDFRENGVSGANNKRYANEVFSVSAAREDQAYAQALKDAGSDQTPHTDEDYGALQCKVLKDGIAAIKESDPDALTPGSNNAKVLQQQIDGACRDGFKINP